MAALRPEDVEARRRVIAALGNHKVSRMQDGKADARAVIDGLRALATDQRTTRERLVEEITGLLNGPSEASTAERQERREALMAEIHETVVRSLEPYAEAMRSLQIAVEAGGEQTAPNGLISQEIEQAFGALDGLSVNRDKVWPADKMLALRRLCATDPLAYSHAALEGVKGLIGSRGVLRTLLRELQGDKELFHEGEAAPAA